MSTPTVRISESSYQILRAVAEQSGRTMMEVLDTALEAYRRKVFFEEMNAGYEALRADPGAWAQEQAERKLWDPTLTDGLDPAESWTEPESTKTPKTRKTKGK